MIGRFLATNTLVIMTIQISRFYRLLRLREEQKQWRSGGAGGTGAAAKMLISKFRSNNDVNGRVPAKASKRHALYKQAQKRVKNQFAKATSVFEKALPDKLSRRNRAKLIKFIDLVLEHEVCVNPSLRAILRFESVDWCFLIELQKTWEKTKSSPDLLPSFLLNVWDVLDGKNGTFSSFARVISCEESNGQRYVDVDWWDLIFDKMDVQCREWLDPFPAGCTWKNGMSYDWWGKVYLNPPWRIWAKVWKHAKLQVEQGTVDELFLVIPNSAWNGYGNVGSPSTWCEQVESFENKTVKRILYSFKKPDGTRYQTNANVICVHVKV